MTNGRAAHRIVMGVVVFSPLFDLISAIRPSKMREKSRRLSRLDCCRHFVAGTLLRPRSAASTVQRSITVAEVTERARQSGVGGAPGVRQRKCLLGRNDVMSRISKKLISRLVVLGLATSVGALGVAISTADVAVAGGKGGGGRGPGGGGGGGGGGGHWGGGGGGGGGHWGGGGVSHFSAAHIGGGHAHFSSHISSHASHWSGGHHYSHVTHYSRTHTTGINTHATNLSKTNLSKTNLSKTNLSNLSKTNHDLTKTGEEKNLNSHVTPLKNASDPKNFSNGAHGAAQTRHSAELQ
jgi:hypothetical protein